VAQLSHEIQCGESVIASTLYVPSVSVKVETTSLSGVRLDSKAAGENSNFDVKVRLEEKERRSQMVVVNFALSLTTKPSVVKFEVEGTATLTGKDTEIKKMLEIDPETKVPYVFQRIYQHVFTAMYLMSTILNVAPPPQDLLFSGKRGIPVEGVSVEVEAKASEGVTIQADTTGNQTKDANVVNP
jgi:hypothetical protein